MDDWCCECTFINDAGSSATCECCGANRPAQAEGQPTHKREQHEHVVCLVDDSDEEQCGGAEARAAGGSTPSNTQHGNAQQHGPPAQRQDAQQGRYVMDCGCHDTVGDLTSALMQQAQQHVLRPAAGLLQAVQSLRCVHCNRLVSNADAFKLLGAAGLSEIYTALVRKVKQAHELAQPSASAPSCPFCAAGTAVLALSALSSSSRSFSLPNKQLLQAALAVRQLQTHRLAVECAKLLESQLGSECKWFCTGCPAAWPSSASAAAAAATAGQEAAAAVQTALQLWEHLVLLQQVTLGGELPQLAGGAAEETAGGSSGGRGRRAAASKSSSKAASKSNSKGRRNSTAAGSAAWAAGTGYGGTAGLNAQAHQAMSAAANRQKQSDAAMRQQLSSIASIISGTPLAGPGQQQQQQPQQQRQQRSSGKSKQQGSQEPAGPAVAPPPPTAGRAGGAGALSLVCCSVLLGGPLAWLLRLLFSNDSMMDVGGRQELYSQGMRLLSLIGSSPDLLPILQLPGEDPRARSTDTPPPATAGSSSSNNTLMAALLRLDQQAKLFRKSAAELIAGDDEGEGDNMSAVCLALDLSSVVQDIAEANNMYNATMATEKGVMVLQPLSAAPGSTPAAAACGPSREGGRQHTQPAASAATGPSGSNTAAAAAAAAFEALYVSALQPHQFFETDDLLKHHYFRSTAEQETAAGGEVMRKRLRRITEELGSLSTSLPVSGDSSILLAVDSQRMDVLRACLLPHPDTPYGGGAFMFDILLPQSYPNSPPQVQFLTTGGGKVRFNPNLYDSGKVCLSLLGTWAGPSWEPGVSTLLQVLVSLQSMVFVTDPWYNEPGYESHAKSASGQQRARAYNQDLRLQTARYAILGVLVSPDPVFRAALQLHFSLKGPALMDMLQRWLAEAGSEKKQLKDVVEQVKVELAKLPPPPPPGQGAAATAAAGNQGTKQQEQRRPTKRQRHSTCNGLGGSGAGPSAAAQDVVDLT